MVALASIDWHKIEDRLDEWDMLARTLTLECNERSLVLRILVWCQRTANAREKAITVPDCKEQMIASEEQSKKYAKKWLTPLLLLVDYLESKTIIPEFKDAQDLVGDIGTIGSEVQVTLQSSLAGFIPRTHELLVETNDGGVALKSPNRTAFNTYPIDLIVPNLNSVLPLYESQPSNVQLQCATALICAGNRIDILLNYHAFATRLLDARQVRYPTSTTDMWLFLAAVVADIIARIDEGAPRATARTISKESV